MIAMGRSFRAGKVVVVAGGVWFAWLASCSATNYGVSRKDAGAVGTAGAGDAGGAAPGGAGPGGGSGGGIGGGAPGDAAAGGSGGRPGPAPDAGAVADVPL